MAVIINADAANLAGSATSSSQMLLNEAPFYRWPVWI
jgi:hypothetical protein